MKKYFFIVSLFCVLRSYATHIVGGEMIYDNLGGNNYRITLKMYRDCYNGIPPFDGVAGPNGFLPALMTIIEANTGNSYTVDIGAPVITNIPPTINSPCIQTPNTVCVEEGIYTYTINLPSLQGGYYIVYQRCCRNNTIINLFLPGNQGSTYYAKIPGPEEVASNSSPRFKNFPPIFLCNNLDIVFDHSATDPDGDKLVYSLCPPFLGGDACCSAIGVFPNCPAPPPSCPSKAPPPPYANVDFVSPYDGSYPIASNPSVSIDPNTGILTGKPTLIGQFVVGVCVQEFRNNVLIGTHYRDFQFNIVPCTILVKSMVSVPEKKCIGNTITFTNQSIGTVGPLVYHWDFGVPWLTNDTSNVTNPTYTYQDTGQYVMTLVVNPGKPCSDTTIKQIYVYPPLTVTFAPQDKQCLKNNSFSFAANGTYAASAKFGWNFSALATPSTAAVKDPSGVVYSEAGKFFVTLNTKQFACRDSFTDSVRVLRRPQAKINNSPSSFCEPAKVGFSNGSTSDLPMKFYWTFSNGATSTAYEPIQEFTVAGLYQATLMAVTEGLCPDTSLTAISNVTIYPLPIAGFSCSPQITSIFEPQIEILNRSSPNVNYWQYDYGDGTVSGYSDVAHYYQDYGDYLISQTVTTQHGCKSTASQTVRILPEYRFWVPNTFTPDDNGLNDLFKPVVMGVLNYNFEVYDRWGQRLFVTSKPGQGWDGKYRGENCKQDVYIWRTTFKNVTTLKDESHCGHVLILRNE